MIVADARVPEPAPRGFWNDSRFAMLRALHGFVRHQPYRNDLADDWTPDPERDCQGKTAWLIEELCGRYGWPSRSMRGYFVTIRPWWARAVPRWLREIVRPHAILVVRVTLDSGAPHDLIADIRKTALVDGFAGHGYLSAAPAVGWRPS